MKSLTIITALLLSFLSGAAQKLDNNGLYITEEGELFSGKLKTNKDNVKSELDVKHGIINGNAVYYYASGKIMETGIFVDGKKDSKWTRYNENGTINAVAFYTMGKKNGTWQVFDDNGKKRFEMNYTDGEKTGVWTSWDDAGAIVSTKNYSISN